MTKFKTQFDLDYTGAEGSINDEPSMTVPDQHLTVQQLLQNHARGIHSDVKEYKGEFFDMEIPVFTDIAEAQEYRRTLQKALVSAENDLEDLRQQKKNEQIQKLKEEQKTQQKPPQQPQEVDAPEE